MSEARLFRVDGEGHLALEWGVAKNDAASKEKGRPVFDKVLLGTILAPSQAKSQPVLTLVRVFPDDARKVYEPHFSKYQAQIEQFERNDGGGDLQGTAIEKWPMIDAPLAASLKAMKVFTVEQLAEASDTVLQQIGIGARDWQKKAINWLAAAKDSAVVGKLTADLGERDLQIADLQRQLQELAARVEAAEKDKPAPQPSAPKGGRAAA